jgi:hypothetical protein
MTPPDDVDLAKASLADVYKHLQCDENGLAADEAARRLEQFGLNQLRTVFNRRQEGIVAQVVPESQPSHRSLTFDASF